MLAVARAPVADRYAVLRAKLDELQPGLWPSVTVRYATNLKDRNKDQAMFDAIRGTLAERVYKRGAQAVRNEVGNKLGWDRLLDTPLGQLSENDRAAGCTIAGGAATAGGIVSIVPVYGTIIGGLIGVGSQIAGGAMDCSREQREAQATLAATQAQQAQQQLLLAQQSAASATVARNRLIMTGGGILGVAALAWILLS